MESYGRVLPMSLPTILRLHVQHQGQIEKPGRYRHKRDVCNPELV
jgi:hypothetical protein